MAARVGRYARRTAYVVLLLALLLHLAGGWYFATMIGRDALAVRSSPAADDLTVLRQSGRTVTVREDGGRDAALRSGGTFGLEWEGGYGLVSGPAREGSDPGTVTRTWTPWVDRVTTSQRVAIDNAAVPPGRLASGEREVVVRGPLGAMPARFRPGQGRTWAILVHGKGASPDEMQRMAGALRPLRLPTLSITYRDDEGNPRDPSGRHQFGRTEWRDLQAAAAYARRHGARDLVLGGASMGGAIIASYLRQTADRSVQAVVLDSPLLDLESAIDFGASQRTVPGTPWPIPGSITWLAKRLATLRYDLDWSDVDYLSSRDWVIAPVLVHHGTRDRTVPVSTSRLLTRDSDQVTLYEEADADHVQSWNYDPTGYDRRVREFVERALG